MDRIRLVALHNFSGPEGTQTGAGRGLIKKGSVFTTTRRRANQLLASGMARVVAEFQPVPKQAMPGPTHQKTLDELTIPQVIEIINEGLIPPETVLELELSNQNRVTLIKKLREMIHE